ncbi:hypothetical protein AB4238_22330, partial [Shewanella sp. 10N.286.45.A1]|uniref:hypothetical protein n=1 Tax=Shewanella sp. 10N.286.45.A1 TaxID=3229694 RepID=UPI00354C40D5
MPLTMYVRLVVYKTRTYHSLAANRYTLSNHSINYGCLCISILAVASTVFAPLEKISKARRHGLAL